eukprot:1833675-Amphidinium_carterae.1
MRNQRELESALAASASAGSSIEAAGAATVSPEAQAAMRDSEKRVQPTPANVAEAVAMFEDLAAT